MRIWHYYHVYAIEGWERIVDEHLDALESSGLAEVCDFRIGVVGDLEVVGQVWLRCNSRIKTTLVAYASEGWEQVTLNRLYDDCKWTPRADEDVLVLYAHTKGVSVQTDFNGEWRASMTRKLIYNWRLCVRLLKEGNEAVGCHWLTPAAYPEQVGIPFFGGNFWWTRPEVLLRSGPPDMNTRYDAESWLGSRPLKKVYDRLPGWPGTDLFRQGDTTFE
jgi:hypothetical protein